MRKIKSEIEGYMNGLTREEGKLTSHFAFPPEFIGFQGHFPGKKILPGVCQIQCALSMLEKSVGKAVELKEIVAAKYFSPLFPDDDMTCAVVFAGDADGDCVVKVSITKSTVKISELKLRVSFADKGGN